MVTLESYHQSPKNWLLNFNALKKKYNNFNKNLKKSNNLNNKNKYYLTKTKIKIEITKNFNKID